MTYPPGQNPYEAPHGGSPYGVPQSPYGGPQGGSPYGAPGVPAVPGSPYGSPAAPVPPASPYGPPANPYASPYGDAGGTTQGVSAPFTPGAPNIAVTQQGGGNGLAVTSLVCGVIPWLLCCGGTLVNFALASSAGHGSGAALGMMGGAGIIGMILSVVQGILALVATICGAVALSKKAPGKGLAIGGTVLGGLYLLLCTASVVIMLVAGAAFLGSLH